MKIAMLTKYGALTASTRQRFSLYAPFLERAGFECISLPLLDDHALSQSYAHGQRSKIHILRRYVDRMQWLVSRPGVDVIWLQYELFPYLPGLLELIVRWPGKTVVYDFDDAIFHNYDIHPNRVVRFLLKNKLQATIGSADLAFCGNAYLEAYARRFCQRTEVVPTIVDTEICRPAAAPRDPKAQPCIGWIGSPSTWTEYLLPMTPMLMDVAAACGGLLSVMGADRSAKSQPLLSLEDWSEAGEVPFLQTLDVGVMPLTDTPWARGKCGFKLIQYMACGLPVVASPVGVNAGIVEHGVNGFLARTETEWREYLTVLLRDPDLRRRMGAEGRRKVCDHYALSVWGPRVAAMLKQTAMRGDGR